MSDRALVPADGAFLDQILESTYAIWHEGLSPAAYRRFYLAQRATPWGRTHLDRLALVQGETVLASAKRYRFAATLDARAIRVVGIGAVFTHPAHRGRGAARELVDRLLEMAAADGDDLGLLFSEIGPDYYARLEFTPIATRDARLRVVESPRYGAPMTMIRGGEDRDLADIAAMHAARAEPYRFHLNRDRDLVHYAIAKRRLLAGLGASSARQLQFFVAEEGSSAAAYIVVTVQAGEWTIEECGDRDPTGARLGAMLQALIAREPAERRPSIRAWLPDGFVPPQVTILAREPAADTLMVRPLTAAARAATSLTEREIVYWKSDRF